MCSYLSGMFLHIDKSYLITCSKKWFFMASILNPLEMHISVRNIHSMKMGASFPARGSSLCQSVSVISVFAPQRTPSPRTIFLAHPITVPLNPHPVPISIVAFSASVEIIHGRLTPMRFEFGRELKPQPEPMIMLLPGCRLKCARPSNQQLSSISTFHHFASIYARTVESRRLDKRKPQHTMCGKLSRVIRSISELL